MTSGITGRGQSALLKLFTRKFLLTYQEKRRKEKGNMEKKRRKILNIRGKRMKSSRGHFFLFFFFSFHFLKSLKFVLGLPKWKFLLGKSISRREKIVKSDFALSEKYSSYTTGHDIGEQKYKVQSGYLYDFMFRIIAYCRVMHHSLGKLMIQKIAELFLLYILYKMYQKLFCTYLSINSIN